MDTNETLIGKKNPSRFSKYYFKAWHTLWDLIPRPLSQQVAQVQISHLVINTHYLTPPPDLPNLLLTAFSTETGGGKIMSLHNV